MDLKVRLTGQFVNLYTVFILREERDSWLKVLRSEEGVYEEWGMCLRLQGRCELVLE